jgi:hypothetical protein
MTDALKEQADKRAVDAIKKVPTEPYDEIITNNNIAEAPQNASESVLRSNPSSTTQSSINKQQGTKASGSGAIKLNVIEKVRVTNYLTTDIATRLKIAAAMPYVRKQAKLKDISAIVNTALEDKLLELEKKYNGGRKFGE